MVFAVPGPVLHEFYSRFQFSAPVSVQILAFSVDSFMYVQTTLIYLLFSLFNCYILLLECIFSVNDQFLYNTRQKQYIYFLRWELTLQSFFRSS